MLSITSRPQYVECEPMVTFASDAEPNGYYLMNITAPQNDLHHPWCNYIFGKGANMFLFGATRIIRSLVFPAVL